jgi:hypothetical protein
MARLEATSRSNGTQTRMTVATMSGRLSSILDIRPQGLAPKLLILPRMMAV